MTIVAILLLVVFTILAVISAGYWLFRGGIFGGVMAQQSIEGLVAVFTAISRLL
jgi:hypothetical protein